MSRRTPTASSNTQPTPSTPSRFSASTDAPSVFSAPNCQLPGCGLAVNDPIHDKRMTHGFHYFVKPNARSLSADVDGTPDEINATIDRMNRIDAAVTAESASFAAAFQMGYEDGAGEMGMTFDDDPESPRSRAYDLGRTMRRSLEGLDEPQAQESKTWTPERTYSLAEVRNGTGWPTGARFAVILEGESDMERDRR